jgi:hypothetical protein
MENIIKLTLQSEQMTGENRGGRKTGQDKYCCYARIWADETANPFFDLRLEAGMALAVGQYAPDIVLESHLGDTIRLSSYRNKCNVVLVFFPLAWTPV